VARFTTVWSLLVITAAFAQSPLEQAVTLARTKRYAEARAILQGVVEPGPAAQRVAFHRLKAAIASGLNEPAAAAGEMQQALVSAPNDAGLLLAAAVAELQAGQRKAALMHGELAMRLEPANEEYRSTLAFALIQYQDSPAAIEVLKPAIVAFPESSRLRTLLGIAQFALGDTEDAAATLSEAISLDAQAGPAYASLAKIVLESSSAPDAKITTQLCEWNATVCSALKLRAARESGDSKLQAEAITGLERAPQEDLVGHCELARGREWTNRLPEARVQMEKCVAGDPSPQNHYRLGLLYQRLGLADLAKKQMELRQLLLTQMSEQTANALAALQAIR
jgi:tetratricopeptide (TPR) repeat protein